MRKTYVKILQPTRTGSTTLTKALGVNKCHKGIEYYDLRKKDKTFFVSTVRNPYERVISMYNFFHVFLGSSTIDNFVDQLGGLSLDKDLFFAQNWYTHHRGELICDKIIRFEDGFSDLDFLSPYFNVINKIGHYNPSENKRITGLTKEQKEKVYEVYKKDFELLGYDK